MGLPETLEIRRGPPQPVSPRSTVDVNPGDGGAGTTIAGSLTPVTGDGPLARLEKAK
ncbi:hypothetical protein GCM10027176_15850 [Actinoallomurus bryophytorum]